MAKKIISRKELNIEAINGLLKEEFPEYEVKIRTSLVGKYVQVRKSAFIGVWVRIKKSKNAIRIEGCVPSDIARGLFFGLIVYAFIASSLSRIENEIFSFLQEKYER